MERMGILEMDELQKLEVLRNAAKGGQPDFAFITILENDFDMIPEGFTGVYMRDWPCQIVPDQLLDKIKQFSVGGFDHAPEDHELHLFLSRDSAVGKWLKSKIFELTEKWLNEN
jgi:hypothetical protein